MVAGLATACRLGGPSADPDQYVAFPDAAKDATSASMPPLSGGGSPPSPAGDASADDLEAGDLEAGDFDAALDDPSTPCSSMVTVPVCDPVHNTGCNPLQQCDVDPAQTKPTGLCLFGGGADGGACTSSIFTESCAPKSTCVDGGCRPLCFCNADCPLGQCCSDRSGPSGFKLCGPCVP